MKIYRMRRSGRGTAIAEIVHPSGEVTPLPHRAYHSPTGFEWGYGGSGPADLARALVEDAAGVDPDRDSRYHRVKFALVAALPNEGGEITQAQILTELGRHTS